MTVERARRPFALGILVVTAILAACQAKQQAPPARTEPPPSVAPPTTTTTTTIPSPPPVWGAARWGMTKEEVLAAFPAEAQRLPQPVAFSSPSPGASDVAIPAYEMGGLKFRVLFGFESEALNRVQLSAIKPGDTACIDLEKLLTEKYSAPADRSTTQTAMRSEQIVWKRPDQTITLACAEAPGLGYRQLALDYTTPR